MEISEVRVKLISNAQERLKAFCSITLDNDFVIRDLKIIDGANGIFVAMPSRKLSDRCPQCSYKNHLRANYCNDCGKPLGDNRTRKPARRGKLHADVAHPINPDCRERIQGIVVKAFEVELEKSREPGYQPPDFDFGEDAHSQDEVSRTDRTDPVERAAPAERAERPERAERVEPAEKTSAETHREEEGGGYDELIAELKSDAEARRQDRSGGTIQETRPEPETASISAEDTTVDASSEPETQAAEPAKETNDFGAGIL